MSSYDMKTTGQILLNGHIRRYLLFGYLIRAKLLTEGLSVGNLGIYIAASWGKLKSSVVM